MDLKFFSRLPRLPAPRWVALVALFACCGAKGMDPGRPPARAPIELLRPGVFHKQEVPADSGEMWLVIYGKDGSYFVKEAPIRIEACEDMGEPGHGKRVSSDISKDALFFVRGVRVPAGPVKTARDKGFSLYPGQDESFQLPGGEWSSLRALGSVEEMDVGEGQRIRMFKDYRLLFSRQPWGEEQILGPFGIDSESSPPSIVWAGDLDGDGHVDLLVEKGGFNSIEWVLYLSSKAHSPGLLELVAARHHIGC